MSHIHIIILHIYSSRDRQTDFLHTHSHFIYCLLELELQTNHQRSSQSRRRKAPTRAFTWLKALTSTCPLWLVSQFHIYLLCLSWFSIVSYKCESTSSYFDPAEGLSRGLLRDCESFADSLFGTYLTSWLQFSCFVSSFWKIQDFANTKYKQCCSLLCNTVTFIDVYICSCLMLFPLLCKYQLMLNVCVAILCNTSYLYLISLSLCWYL